MHAASSAAPPPRAAAYRPQLTNAARPATFDVPAVDENGVVREVAVAG
jgi:hypothetical protein